MIFFRGFTLCVSIPLLLACAPDATELELAEPQVQESASPGAETAVEATVEDVMSLAVQPNVDKLWRAVSYIATAEGVTETAPTTAEDWAELRASALALIAAGDELTDTDREILTSEFDPSTAAFQFTPEEIRVLLAEDSQPWQSYIQQMQDSTRMTLQAIEFRDLMGLQEFGAQINEACEGCHAAYWYRAPGSMVPR